MDERALLTSLRATLLFALVVFGKDSRFRRSFVMVLSEIEDALGLERTCPPRVEGARDRAKLAQGLTDRVK
jgi:hypothetical protein